MVLACDRLSVHLPLVPDRTGNELKLPDSKRCHPFDNKVQKQLILPRGLKEQLSKKYCLQNAGLKQEVKFIFF